MKQGRNWWLVVMSLIGTCVVIVAPVRFQQLASDDPARLIGAGESEAGGDAPEFSLKRVDSRALPNALRINSKVISGGLPAGEVAFQELQLLGVKTIISVDGASPDVALAEKYGLRYVHLPHGYDGISKEQQATLAKAVRDLPGPIYVHCHHGIHRSPAATAAACRTLGWLTAAQAMSVLKVAGTSPNYRGLFQTVENAEPMDDEFLTELVVEFRSVAELPPLAKSMVEMEYRMEHLRLLQRNEWRPLPEHPDLNPSHEVLMLREHFTELLRTDVVASEDGAFVRLMRESEADSLQLERLLRDTTLPSENRSSSADALMAGIADKCVRCHSQFRDVPLNEKSR